MPGGTSTQVTVQASQPQQAPLPSPPYPEKQQGRQDGQVTCPALQSVQDEPGHHPCESDEQEDLKLEAVQGSVCVQSWGAACGLWMEGEAHERGGGTSPPGSGRHAPADASTSGGTAAAAAKGLGSRQNVSTTARSSAAARVNCCTASGGAPPPRQVCWHRPRATFSDAARMNGRVKTKRRTRMRYLQGGGGGEGRGMVRSFVVCRKSRREVPGWGWSVV